MFSMPFRSWWYAWFSNFLACCVLGMFVVSVVGSVFGVFVATSFARYWVCLVSVIMACSACVRCFCVV